MSGNKIDEKRISSFGRNLTLLGPEATSCLVGVVSQDQCSHWIKFLVRGSGLNLLTCDPGLRSLIPLSETSANWEYAGANP